MSCFRYLDTNLDTITWSSYLHKMAGGLGKIIFWSSKNTIS